MDEDPFAALDTLLAAAPAVDHQSRAHSSHSASGAERFINCPGSIRAQEGRPDRKSKDAELGTAAHELANICLESGQDADEYIDRVVHGHDVDEEMATAVQVYLDWCRRYMAIPNVQYFIERRFSLGHYNPPVDMFGTSDFSAYDPARRRLIVIDYKHGVGKVVDAVGNPQLRYYALGLLTSLPADMPVDDVEMWIVQPRARIGKDIKGDECSALELLAFAGNLLAAVDRTLEPSAPLFPGSWCQFCKVDGICEAQAQVALSGASVEFAAVASFDDIDFGLPGPLAEVPPEPKLRPPELRLLSLAQIAALIPQLDMLDTWIKAVRAAALDETVRGHMTEFGWTTEPTRPTRKWVNEEEQTAEALVALGLPPDKLYKPRKLITPAQAQTVLKEAHASAFKTKKDADAAAAKRIASLEHPVSSGVKLARISESLPAIASGGSEFTALLPAPPDPSKPLGTL